MHIHSYSNDVATRQLDAFNEAGLFYELETAFSSLLSPSATILSAQEVQQLTDDLAALWEFYDEWTALYLCSLAGSAPGWIARTTEYGMSDVQVHAHRQVASAGLQPRMCRVDYVDLGDRRQIAEVQWGSGGPGLFLAIHDVVGGAGVEDTLHAPLGGALSGYAEVAWQMDSSILAVNSVSDKFLAGEGFVRREYERRGLRYVPITWSESSRLVVDDLGVYLLSDQARSRVEFLYGPALTAHISGGTLSALAEHSMSGRVWVETPLNWIYRQKWGMALPFMAEYADRFSPRLRQILAPTVLLLTSERPDFGAVVQYVAHDMRHTLEGLSSLEDLAELPDSLRRLLVLKCGAGTGPYMDRSRGVFRIGGSRSSALKTLRFVSERISVLGEPWILQPYVDRTFDVPLSLPSAPEDVIRTTTHARFMVFGRCRAGDTPQVLCGLANFGRHWKVSGKSSFTDGNGYMGGTAYTDIRVDGEPSNALTTNDREVLGEVQVSGT